jgi:adenylate cyclase class 2
MTNNHLEVEVKFLLSDLVAMQERLRSSGATLHHPRTYERNIRFDDVSQGLKNQGKLLRLRQDSAARLTFKGRSSQMADSEARVMEELEVEVEDFDIMARILGRIGFEGVQTYEKYRETYRLSSVEIVLDEMPFGDFIELEGDEAAIREAAEELSLNWDYRILENYLVLMDKLRDRHNLSFNDLTFANFDGLNLSVADLFIAPK